ncbi:MAG: Ribosomal protein [Francisellaceae bacterium]|nr:Ribosomal protein [Francisellaceae bacterium]
MAIVRAREGESPDSLLRRYKRLLEKEGKAKKQRLCEFFIKPSQVRKRAKAAAIKRHQKKAEREAQMMSGRERRAH